MSKKSIRFFNDREVKAVWDDENSLDTRSKRKAYDLWERQDGLEPGTVKCLQQIHAYIFVGLYEFAS